MKTFVTCQHLFGMLDTFRMSIVVTEYTNELMHDYLIVLYLWRKNGEIGNGSFLQRDATDRPFPVHQHALFPGHPPALTVMQEAEGGVKCNSFY